MGGPLRLLYTIASLFLPPVLYARIWRIRRGRVPFGRFIRATPWIVALLVAWCLGESVGTFTGRYNPLPTKDMG